jgi:phosphoglycolate phosphatase
VPPIPCKCLIFDLDGTLIDSAPSILSCFSKVLKETGVSPREPLDERLIGPPLAQTLQNLTGIHDEAVIAAMIGLFKQYYDTEGYRDSLPYAGVAEALAELKASGYELALATNKRILPTRLILGHLGWDVMFSSVWALDSFEPRLTDKTAMLHEILNRSGVMPELTVYIGDKVEDGLAAQANAMHFVAARWGYGEFDGAPEHWQLLDSPIGLVSIFEPMGD